MNQNQALISSTSHIIIKGARQHNLQNINLNLPKNKLVVFTGLSGSGKSSLAFDTIYAEGQRRYVESLSSYARQFLGIMQKPDVDSIDGLSPAISIDQKSTSHNPRSTVGTITEIYDYLRLLFARIGHPHCPQCGSDIAPQTTDQIATSIIAKILDQAKPNPIIRFYLLSPVVRDKRGEFSGLFSNLKKKGFTRVRVDGRTYDLDEDFLLIKTNRHSIAVILDRISLESKSLHDPASVNALSLRLRPVIEKGLDLSQGLVIASFIRDKSLVFPDKPVDFIDQLYSQRLACPTCNLSFPELEPRLFSFNTPEGACPQCTGLGSILKVDPNKIIAGELSLSEGAVIPLANALSSDSWYARKLQVVTESLNADYRSPYNQLPVAVQKIILYGSPTWLKVSGNNRQGREASFSFQWEGVINELTRRFQETQSEYIRGEISRFMSKEICAACQGARLKPAALSVTIDGQNIIAVTNFSIRLLHDFIKSILLPSPKEKAISLSILKEIVTRTDFLLSVGLDYLSLSREASTLAGGEAQRIRLASQIGSGLTGVLYVLDEPTIGLHPRDSQRLIQTLLKLRDLGNTVIVVEHDRDVMAAADFMVDFGPLAGQHGGQIVATGTLSSLMAASNSLTGKYLKGAKQINAKSLSQKTHDLHHSLTLPHLVNLTPVTGDLTLVGARQNNLKNITVNFPLGKFVLITGVSGSGKSSLMHDTLYPALKLALQKRPNHLSAYDHVDGYDPITKVLFIDQSPIGRTPRSNPATYTKAFDHIRDLFAQTKEARLKGFKPGRFSFNVKGGRCEACGGGGEVKISMQFLPDIYVQCEVCKGLRYNADTLDVHYLGLTIAEVLNLTVSEAISLFKNHSQLTKQLATLKAVGLGYLKLGQPAPNLSGGEAQRVKLAKELSVSAIGHTVYLLDEPTTGLHFEDINNLLVVLKQLVLNNNTVIIIEHNQDVIKNADWIIDLGPEGGANGGQVVAVGPPKTIIDCPASLTGQFLKKVSVLH